MQEHLNACLAQVPFLDGESRRSVQRTFTAVLQQCHSDRRCRGCEAGKFGETEEKAAILLYDTKQSLRKFPQFSFETCELDRQPPSPTITRVESEESFVGIRFASHQWKQDRGPRRPPVRHRYCDGPSEKLVSSTPSLVPSSKACASRRTEPRLSPPPPLRFNTRERNITCTR